MIKVLVRIVAALAGAATGFYFGGNLGCVWYEATGPKHSQCGYEFEGMYHVIFSALSLALVFGFAAQWLAGVLTRRRSR